MARRGLLISVKPKYAEMLLTGTKTVELRRIRPSISAGDWVLVYASSPRKALLGAFQVAEVNEANPETLWRKVGSQVGISYDDFCEYFRGTCRGTGIHVGRTIRFPEPTPLQQMREIVPGFNPPQSYTYASAGSILGDVLLELVEECGSTGES
ncbi:MAG: ASCH domain-containing protein [Candidatus Atribacteria bacterium]|nr:MAG: ASCH domain-containing protein [Candidatus Atribacteria bacterium]